MVVTRVLALLFIFVAGFGVWSSCQHGQDISRAVEINPEVHITGDINSRLMYVDETTKEVQVLTFEDIKRDIVFEADDGFLYFLKEEKVKILPVAFICGKKRNLECDLTKPYVLYVATRKVKPLLVRKNAAS